jgi:hypothetical protein
MRIILSFIFILITIGSCGTYKIKKKLNGLWIIEEIRYNGKDVFSDFLSNAIELNEEKVTLPGLNNLEITTWNLTKNNSDYIVKFNSEESIFKEEFKVIFYRESDFNKIDLVSSTTIVKCSKSEFQKLE